MNGGAPILSQAQGNMCLANDPRQNQRCCRRFDCQPLLVQQFFPLEHKRNTYDKNCGTSLTRFVATHMKSNPRKHL